jgi:hypothetical protein
LNYLTADDWVLIQAKAVPQTYKLGDEIIREGGWGDSIYIIRRREYVLVEIFISCYNGR